MLDIQQYEQYNLCKYFFLLRVYTSHVHVALLDQKIEH